MTQPRRFLQVDVFGQAPLLGNPLAVVVDAEGLSSEQMQAFARWTNLSETTFLLPPTTPEADYRVRIFTVSGELPFAGHPTLGSAFAWLWAGGQPHCAGVVMQECAAGLIPVRQEGDRLSFAAPPPTRSGPLDPATLATIAEVLGLKISDITAHQWLYNGPRWAGVLLSSAKQVRALNPDLSRLGELELGAIGPYPADHPEQFEVRTFYAEDRLAIEDPVTGSFNAAAAQWLIEAQLAPSHYVAAQGMNLQRDGRVYLHRKGGGQVWAGGKVWLVVAGEVKL